MTSSEVSGRDTGTGRRCTDEVLDTGTEQSAAPGFRRALRLGLLPAAEPRGVSGAAAI